MLCVYFRYTFILQPFIRNNRTNGVTLWPDSLCCVAAVSVKMVKVQPLNKRAIVKKKTTKFKRHQSDMFMRVPVRVPVRFDASR